VGVSQHRCPLAIRERLAVGPAELPDVLRAFHGRAREAFVLSTCNRVEVYAVADTRAEAESAGRQFFASRAAVAALPDAQEPYCHTDDLAVRHLFRVVSGLDSMVLGEAQISGQVRRSMEAARGAGLVGNTLAPLGAAALACGKRVRTSTGIGRHAVSVVSMGLGEMGRVLEAWAGRRVVIVGAGYTAQLVVKHLTEIGGVHLTLIGRTPARAKALAERYGVSARPFSELSHALTESDALITCTAAPHHVVLEEHLVEAGFGQGGRQLVCLDLGVPRDIDPLVRQLSTVQLIDVDRVQALSDLYRSERERDAVHAASVVEAEVERYLRWCRVRDVIPAIVEVREMAEAVGEDELSRALARLPHLAARDIRVVEDLVRRVVGKLLHGPTAALRASGDPGLAEAARRLFAPVPRRASRRDLTVLPPTADTPNG
jgi:glutamyl-tRNA reductase